MLRHRISTVAKSAKEYAELNGRAEVNLLDVARSSNSDISNHLKNLPINLPFCRPVKKPIKKRKILDK